MGVADLADYPWDAVAPYAERARAHPDGIVDLSIGSPVDPTPAVVAEALARRDRRARLPADRRHAGAARGDRRLVRPPPRRARPHAATRAAHDRLEGARRAAAAPARISARATSSCTRAPRTPPTRSARGSSGRPRSRPTTRPSGRTARGSSGSTRPGNPDGRVLDAASLRAAVARARELGAVLASDECYAELGWDAPWDRRADPVGARPARHRTATSRGILSVYSLSKQSNLAGYRAAFLAGDPAIVARLLTARKHLGLMLPAPVQAAMIAALGDDAHVAAQKERYRARARAAQARARGRGLPHRPQRGGAVPLGDRGPRRVGEPRRGSPTSASSPGPVTSTARTSRSTCACRSPRPTSASPRQRRACARHDRRRFPPSDAARLWPCPQ